MTTVDPEMEAAREQEEGEEQEEKILGGYEDGTESRGITSSSHRLPTLSAAEALRQERATSSEDTAKGNPRAGGPILLHLPRLDALLGGLEYLTEDNITHTTTNDDGKEVAESGENDSESTSKLASASFENKVTGAAGPRRKGGVPRGQVTEVYGPPGVGKTAFCIQAAVSALRDGHRVVWIDTATPLPGPRLKQVLLSSRPNEETTERGAEELPKATATAHTNEQLSRLSHYDAPTLAHLLALVSHPPATGTFPPPDTALVVIDSLSASVDAAFPRNAEHRAASTPGTTSSTVATESKADRSRWHSDRRGAAVSALGASLSSLALSRDIAVLVTSNTVTKVRVGQEALLRPAMLAGHSHEWDSAVGTRVVLFRDWIATATTARGRGEQSSARFAELVKSSADGGSGAGRGLGRRVVAFQIYQDGIREMAETAEPAQTSPVKASAAEADQHHQRRRQARRKRHHDEIDDSQDAESVSGGDSSSSEYGWNEADDQQLAAEGLVDASFV